MSVLTSRQTCPCGGSQTYDACCGPVVRNERPARTSEELMRSRYTAYAVGASDHLFRSWHPRTRPSQIDPDPGLTWTKLEVIDVDENEEAGVVEFRAHWSIRGQVGVLHERSRFERRAGRWVYVEAAAD